MTLALNDVYLSQDLLPTVRAFLSRHPEAADCGAEEVANFLRVERLVTRRVGVHEIRAVSEALLNEDEIVALTSTTTYELPATWYASRSSWMVSPIT